MKIGQPCASCGADHWILGRAGRPARCGVCQPSKINAKREWPRLVKVQHADFIRKEPAGKNRVMTAHRATFADVDLAKCVAVQIDKIGTERGEFYYRVKPIWNHEAKTFREAKSMFVMSRQPKASGREA